MQGLLRVAQIIIEEPKSVSVVLALEVGRFCSEKMGLLADETLKPVAPFVLPRDAVDILQSGRTAW